MICARCDMFEDERHKRALGVNEFLTLVIECGLTNGNVRAAFHWQVRTMTGIESQKSPVI